MHKKYIIHRNLKLSNILIDSECHVKLSGFGNAISKDNYERYRKPYPWKMDGLLHLDSYTFFEAMNEVYKELREEYSINRNKSYKS